MICINSLVESFKRDSHIKRAVIRHSKLQPLRQALSFAFDWSCIISAAMISIKINNPLVYAISVVVIAARQHGLLVLMHEGAHMRLAKNIRLNDFFSNTFAAYPVLISTSDYRTHHTAHHKHTNSDKDPDWIRKIPLAEWQFPQSKAKILKNIFKQLFVGGWEWISLMARLSKKDWKKALYWCGTLAIIGYFNIWKEAVLYWFIPLLTFFPMFQRIRSISEHFGLQRNHELNASRNILSNPLERFFFSPHNVNYHLAHHLFPSVPQYQLKFFHQELKKHPVYAEHSHYNNSFLGQYNSVFADLHQTTTNTSTTDAFVAEEPSSSNQAS